MRESVLGGIATTCERYSKNSNLPKSCQIFYTHNKPIKKTAISGGFCLVVSKFIYIDMFFHPFQGLGFDLPDTLAGYPEFLTHFFESMGDSIF
jgi:hypothetical protein